MPQEKLQLDVIPLEWNSDRLEVMRLEIQHEYPWTEKEFISHCGISPCWKHIIVRDHTEKLLGYLITKGEYTNRYIMNIMVEAEYRLKGVGHRMIRAAIEKGRKHRVKNLMVEVRETNLDAQCFFRSCGFQCVNTIKGYYEDCDEDCYVFKRSIS